jgi:N-acetylneuraminic acid mutarotase
MVFYPALTYSTVDVSSAYNNSSAMSIPEVRFGHSMVYLFGGSSDNRYFSSKDDLWTYDYATNNWIELTPAVGPAVRLSFAMVYDPDSQRIILFGGNSITAGWELDDTWIYDYQTNTWTNANPTIKPPGRSDHAMAYDPVTKKTVLFGGMRDVGDTTYLLNDTWTYDFETNTWTELTPEISPQERYGARMVYNSGNEKIVLYGGNSFGNLSDDGKIWTFDTTTTTWESLDSTEEAGPRYWHGLTFDEHENELVVFGGTDLEPEVSQSDETWEFSFNLNLWTDLTKEKRPPACSLLSIVYDQENKKVVLFGGLAFVSSEIYGKVWIYDPQTHDWIDRNPGGLETQGTGFQGLIWMTGLGLIILIIRRKKNS